MAGFASLSSMKPREAGCRTHPTTHLTSYDLRVPVDVQDAALVAFLRREGPEYAAKVSELRDEVSRWLSYTTASFSHYTAHTVDHSDEIVQQVSNLLFRPEEPQQPIIDLSSAEAYIICAAALLHDTGMVISDAELRGILDSPAWRGWLKEEPSAGQRLEEIRELRTGNTSEDEVVRNFIADRQMRYLVMDYVRRFHHRRSARFLTENQAALGRFAFDDPALIRTIASVCTAHGLNAYELEDRDDYPEQRDIRGEKVNVRFCALLLRLGDLLDMRYTRACPLLLNAASPLPPDSLAHWTQYQRIVHRETDPDRIEVTAECETQDEHRYLHDWCDWLVKEIGFARAIMAHATRHPQWTPPAASISPEGTIKIRPSDAASYVAVDWQIRLDTEAVFNRLIHDVNPEPAAFLRELLQNAFDASRCHLYERMRAGGEELPAYPHHAPQHWRDGFPVHVTRASTTRFNELSQQDEERESIVVEDLGMGMDNETILKYLLQIGRSYYTSEEFLRRYPFVPTSRFGVGFLSVFANADEVRVETRHISAAEDAGIALTLKGPRSYVLTERIRRPTPGTRIAVTLRAPLDVDITELVERWCRRVEFPVVVFDRATPVELRAETPSAFCYEEPSAIDEGERMGVRSFPISGEGLDGELYLFYIATPKGESWGRYQWAEYTYPSRHPEARPPRLPPNAVFFHGMTTSESPYSLDRGVTARIDYRRELSGVSLNRQFLTQMPDERLGLSDPTVHNRLIELVQGHLAETEYARGDSAWSYKQRLMSLTGFDDFWIDVPGTVRAFQDGRPTSLSLGEMRKLDPLTVVMPMYRARYHIPSTRTIEAVPPELPGLVVWSPDLVSVRDDARQYVFTDLAVDRVYWPDDDALCVEWRQRAPAFRLKVGYGAQLADVVALPRPCIGLRTHRAFNETYDHALLNEDHNFVRWLIAVHDAASDDPPRVAAKQWESLCNLLATPLWHSGLEVDRLANFIEAWGQAQVGDLPPPPELPSRDMFVPEPVDR
jgi:molecular chaperone HtpG